MPSYIIPTSKGLVRFYPAGDPIEEIPAHVWSMECENCGRRFTDGIDAGNHEILNPGHKTSFIA